MNGFRHAPFLLAFYMIANSLLGILPCVFGYFFRPYSMIGYGILIIGITVGLTVLAVRNKEETSKLSASFCPLLPLIAIVSSLINPLTVWNLGENDWIFSLLFCINIGCSITLFFTCGRGKVYRAIAGSVTAFILVLLICIWSYVSFIYLFFGSLGVNTVIKEIESPDGAYTAYVIDSDQGALGGDTLVQVSANKGIPLLVGELTQGEKTVYIGPWGEFNEMTIYWIENDVLFINGEEYPI